MIFRPDYSFMRNLPQKTDLLNPLTDIPVMYQEEDEMYEFYKLCSQYYAPGFGMKYLLNMKAFPYQMGIIMAMLRHKFPLLLCTRGGGKSFLLAVYAVYSAVFIPNSKIVIVSAGFRQAKLVFEYIQTIHKNSPLLRYISEGQPTVGVGECRYKVCNGSTITALPLGQGDKIRGHRANITIVDEINSVSMEIFDVVIRGFSAVELDPWEKVKRTMLRHKKGESVVPMSNIAEGNKIVISGTAGFRGEPMYKMWKQYSTIIANKAKGRAQDYKHLFGDEHFDEDVYVNYKDYCIIRLPYTEIPKGLMDLSMIYNARVTMPSMLFKMEYMTIFADDSAGFYKAKDIREATSNGPQGFDVELSGNPKRQYVIGVDPARSMDNTAIVIIAIGSPHKVVYVWTSKNKKSAFVVAQIFKLVKAFENIKGIIIDSYGGGANMADLLSDKRMVPEGMRPLYLFDDESQEAKEGDKIVYLQNPATTWIDEANHCLQGNIENKTLMFPLETYNGKISSTNRQEQIDDVLDEIREMKKELVSIEVTMTKTGRRHFDLMPPDLRTGGDNETPRHKDRYSALVLANWLASKYTKITTDEKQERARAYRDSPIGGWLSEFGSGRK